MHWKIKAAAFRILDWPGGRSAHYFLQRHVTRTWPRPAQTLDALWDAAARVIDDYKNHCAGTPPSSVFELGAGRDLAVPLALRAMGVGIVYSVDVSRLARLPLIRHAAAHMAHKAGGSAPRLEFLERSGAAGHHLSGAGGRTMTGRPRSIARARMRSSNMFQERSSARHCAACEGRPGRAALPSIASTIAITTHAPTNASHA